VLKNLIKRFPSSARYHKASARVSYLAGNFEEAAQAYIKALELAEVDEKQSIEAPGILRSLAALAFTVGEEQEALCYSLEELRRGMTRDAVLRHARLLNGLNMPHLAQLAVEQFQVGGGGRGDVDILQQLALAHLAENQFELAVRVAQRVIQGETKAANGAFELVLVFELAGGGEPRAGVSPANLAQPEQVHNAQNESKSQDQADSQELQDEDEQEKESIFLDVRLSEPQSIADLSLYWPAHLWDMLRFRVAQELAKEKTLES